MSKLSQRLLDIGFRSAMTRGGQACFENALVRVCPEREEGTDVYVFSDRIGCTCAYSMHFSGSTPVDVIVAAANKAVLS